MEKMIRKIASYFIRKKIALENALDKRKNPYNFVNECFVISFPKSSRTWLRIMLEELNVRLSYSHSKDAWLTGNIPFNKIHYDARTYRRKKIIFLTRDPRDVVVSAYFQVTKRMKLYEESIPISDFIRDEANGIRKIVAFYNLWDEHKEVPQNFLLLTYEEMHHDTVSSLLKILDFLHIKDIDPHRLTKVVEFYRFENMQKLEKQKYFTKKYHARLIPRDADDLESFKVRKGKVSGYIDYLTQPDIDYCNNVMRQMNCAWYNEI